MVGIGGSSQDYNADIYGEPKNNLAYGSAVAFSYLHQFVMGHHRLIGGQQRKPLVGYPIGAAELTYLFIPTPGRVTPVLNEARLNTSFFTKSLYLFKGDIANAD